VASSQSRGRFPPAPHQPCDLVSRIETCHSLASGGAAYRHLSVSHSTRPFIRTGVALNRVLDIGGATACARSPFGERSIVWKIVLAELRHRGTAGFVVGSVRDSSVRSNLNQIELLGGSDLLTNQINSLQARP